MFTNPINNTILRLSIVALFTKIQSLSRMYINRQNYVSFRKAILAIQSEFRNKIQMRSSIKNHRLVRSNKYMKIFIDFNALSIFIQKYMRMFLVRKNYDSLYETSQSTVYSDLSEEELSQDLLSMSISPLKVKQSSKPESTVVIPESKVDPVVPVVQEVISKPNISKPPLHKGKKRILPSWINKKSKITTVEKKGNKGRRCGICKEVGHTRRKCNRTYFHARNYSNKQMEKALNAFIDSHKDAKELKGKVKTLIQKAYVKYGACLYKKQRTHEFVREVTRKFGNGKNAGFIKILKSTCEKYDEEYEWPASV